MLKGISKKLWDAYLESKRRWEAWQAERIPLPIELGTVEFRSHVPVTTGHYLKYYQDKVSLVYLDDQEIYGMGERPGKVTGQWAGPLVLEVISVDVPNTTMKSLTIGTKVL